MTLKKSIPSCAIPFYYRLKPNGNQKFQNQS